MIAFKFDGLGRGKRGFTGLAASAHLLIIKGTKALLWRISIWIPFSVVIILAFLFQDDQSKYSSTGKNTFDLIFALQVFVLVHSEGYCCTEVGYGFYFGPLIRVNMTTEDTSKPFHSHTLVICCVEKYAVPVLH